MDLNGIMLDLETMSTHDNASIVSIGAVRFVTPTMAALGGVIDTFYTNVDLESCMDAGLHVEIRTVKWWELQSVEARTALKIDPKPLSEALTAFSAWYNVNPYKIDPMPVWSNPATFDLVILGNAYRALNMPVPFEFFNERCYRTVRTLFPEENYVKPTVPHNALEDALAQTNHLLKLLRWIADRKIELRGHQPSINPAQ
jgi:exodeoxyribonuclease VIII